MKAVYDVVNHRVHIQPERDPLAGWLINRPDLAAGFDLDAGEYAAAQEQTAERHPHLTPEQRDMLAAYSALFYPIPRRPQQWQEKPKLSR